MIYLRNEVLEMLTVNDVILNQATESPEDAIKRSGELLVKAGYAEEKYIEGMILRDQSFSVAIGNLIAIPHGELAYKAAVKKTGLSVITYPDGIDWNGTPVKLVIGIAANGDEHMEILENIVDVLEEEEDVENLIAKNSKEAIIEAFTK